MLTKHHFPVFSCRLAGLLHLYRYQSLVLETWGPFSTSVAHAWDFLVNSTSLAMKMKVFLKAFILSVCSSGSILQLSMTSDTDQGRTVNVHLVHEAETQWGWADPAARTLHPGRTLVVSIRTLWGWWSKGGWASAALPPRTGRMQKSMEKKGVVQKEMNAM